MKKVMIGLAFSSLVGCATIKYPYVNESSIHEYRLDWFSDGAGKVFRVWNPTNEKRIINVVCAENGSDGMAPRFSVVVKAHDFWVALGQVMNRDQMTQTCEVESHDIVGNDVATGFVNHNVF